MPDELNFERDAADWPNRAASRRLTAGGVHWHVQVAGSGPPLLLLHGTGASTHSWAGLFPLLAADFTVIAPDLPGQGFSRTDDSSLYSMTGMARALSSLLTELALTPKAGVGHSAGAAILTRMALDGQIPPAPIVSINGAFVPFGGTISRLFSPLAKLMVMNPVVPHIFAWRAGDRRAVERLLENTGSNVPAASVSIYQRLFASPSHVAGTLAMMASWDLATLYADLSRLHSLLLLIAAENDKTVPPGDAALIARLVKTATVLRLPGVGHLAHEEAPDRIAAIVRETMAAAPALR